MTAEDVVGVVAAVEAAGVKIWLDGGWGIDALVGVQSREHRDVDVVAELSRVAELVAAVAPLGFAVGEDHLPTRLVLRTPRGRQVDVHPITFDADGTGWQAAAGPDGSDCPYPADGFASGTISGRAVGCLAAHVQVEHHRGYEPSDVDRADLRLLHDTFGVALPPTYEPVSVDRPDTRGI